MSLAPVLDLTDAWWMDLPAAATYAGVTLSVMLAAASRGDVAAVVTHPRRTGEWMVRTHDVNRWWRQEVVGV